jgi:formamidopyrimidine-DNA glycosylase
LPELPECERYRRIAGAAAAGRRIVSVHAAADPIVLDGVSPAGLRRALLGRLVVAAHRRGKHVWLELDARPWPLFHFGMTGAFRVPGEAGPALARGPRDDDASWPPRFTKLRLGLDDGGALAFTNARRLGRVRLRDDPASEPPVSRLGFDPLLDLPAPAAFRDRIARRGGTLKGLLLDQGFAAGVGNWIADEVLYQARLDPRREPRSLSDEEARRLRDRLRRVVRTAVAADADSSRFPRRWLFHRRWGRRRDARTADGEAIRHETVAGRTTAWVPGVQR